MKPTKNNASNSNSSTNKTVRRKPQVAATLKSTPAASTGSKIPSRKIHKNKQPIEFVSKQNLHAIKMPFKNFTTHVSYGALSNDHVILNPIRHNNGNARLSSGVADAQPTSNIIRFAKPVPTFRTFASKLTSVTNMSKTRIAKTTYEDDEEEDVDIIGDGTSDVHDVTPPTISKCKVSANSWNVGNKKDLYYIEHNYTRPNKAQVKNNINVIGDVDTGGIKFGDFTNTYTDSILIPNDDFYSYETPFFGLSSFESDSTLISVETDDCKIFQHCDTQELLLQAAAIVNEEPFNVFLTKIHQDERLVLERRCGQEDEIEFLAHFGLKPENVAKILHYYDKFRNGPDVNLELFRRHDTHKDVYDTLWNLSQIGSHFLEMKQCDICRKWGPVEGYSIHHLLVHARTFFGEIYQDKLI